MSFSRAQAADDARTAEVVAAERRYNDFYNAEPNGPRSNIDISKSTLAAARQANNEVYCKGANKKRHIDPSRSKHV